MNSKQKGDFSELKVATRLTELGYVVSFPFGDRAPYDLIVDIGGKLSKVQVKHGRIINGTVLFKTMSVSTLNGKAIINNYNGKVDHIACYCTDNDTCYMISTEKFTVSEMSLRIDPPKNNMKKGINWSKDYIL